MDASHTSAPGHKLAATCEQGLSQEDHVNEAGADIRKTNHEQAQGPRDAKHLPCGFINLGNTCYMNAALQCLGSVIPLRDYLTKGAVCVVGGCMCDTYYVLLTAENLGDTEGMHKQLAVMMRHVWHEAEPFAPHEIKV